MDPHLDMRRENRGSTRVVAGPSVFLTSRDGYVGELLELLQGCQGPFRGSRGKVGLLSRCRSGKGPHLALRGESPGFLELRQQTWCPSPVTTETSGTLPLGPQEHPVSMRGARGLLVFLCHRCRGRGPHLKLRPGSQASSPVPTWISGYFWSFHRGVRPHLMWRHASPLSSRAGKAVRISVELT